jgi:hypothetical protein
MITMHAGVASLVATTAAVPCNGLPPGPAPPLFDPLAYTRALQEKQKHRPGSEAAKTNNTMAASRSNGGQIGAPARGGTADNPNKGWNAGPGQQAAEASPVGEGVVKEKEKIKEQGREKGNEKNIEKGKNAKKERGKHREVKPAGLEVRAHTHTRIHRDGMI